MKGCKSPEYSEAKLLFPEMRGTSESIALKSVHQDGACASYNKIVVYCNNCIFLFFKLFSKMLFKRRAVFGFFVCNFVNKTAVD